MLQHIVHPIPPFYDETSKILVLGSFPSVKSRESGFFYGHPQNRFWKVMAALFSEELPKTVPEKAAFLKKHLEELTAFAMGSGSASLKAQGWLLRCAPSLYLGLYGGLRRLRARSKPR